jgi:hypothetical protein
MACEASQFDASQLTDEEIQPSAFFTFMPVTEPAAKLLKDALDCQVVPLSTLYCKPAPNGLSMVTLPVAGPQRDGCVTQIDGASGTAGSVLTVTSFPLLEQVPLEAVKP